MSRGMPILLENRPKIVKTNLPGLRPGPDESTHLWTRTPVSLDPPPRPRDREIRTGIGPRRPAHPHPHIPLFLPFTGTV